MKPIGIAIIGFGKIAADSHVPAIAGNDRFKLLATASRSGQGVARSFTDWRTLIPENEGTLQTITGVGGRLYAVYSYAASHRVCLYADDGTYLRDLALPGLGSVNRNEGAGVVSGVSGSWAGEEVVLTATEFRLLEVLMQRPGRVFSRDELCELAYPDSRHVSGRTLDSHIRRIRAKFREHGLDPVETVHGVGYRLRGP